MLTTDGRRLVVAGGEIDDEIDVSDGSPVLMVSDVRLWEALSDHANAGYPLRVFTIDGERVVNVTRDYPVHVAADATYWWRAFAHPTNGPGSGLGDLAAWVADEWSLGRRNMADAELHALFMQGRLNVRTFGRPRGARYIRVLERELVQHGYGG